MFVVTPKGLSDCSIFIRILLQFKYLVSKVKKKNGSSCALEIIMHCFLSKDCLYFFQRVSIFVGILN